MVRNTRIEALEATPRPIIAAGFDHPDGHVIAPHQHRRGQLLYAASGAVLLATAQGTWLMPPQHGLWIPAGVRHEVRMLGAVTLLNLYLEPEAAEGLPGRCQVVAISPLLRSLAAEAVDLPPEYDLEGRAGALMSLILHEIRRLPAVPLSLPLPSHRPLAARCRRFIARPTPHETIEDWCAALGLSRRSFTRLFRRETGLSFVAWRQRACLVVALPRLIAGDSVTAIAMDLGYENPAAFTTMFRRTLGAPPRRYLSQQG